MITAEKLYWDRIYAKLDIKCDDDIFDTEGLHFYLINKDYNAFVEFDAERISKNEITLTLNVTNNGLNRCIGNGTYRIIASANEELLAFVCYQGTYEVLANCGRSYNYGNNKGIYTVTYIVSEEDDDPVLFMRIYNTSAGGKYNKAATVSWAPPKPEKTKTPFFKRIKSKIKKSYKKRANSFKKKIYRIGRKLYRGKKHLLFLSEQNEEISLNMQALYERMLERGLDKEFKIDFSLRRSASQKYSVFSSLREAVLIAKADIIIIDDHVPEFDRLLLDDDVKLIQIWHAGAGFKGVGYSRWGHFGCPTPFCCHRQYDFCISGSESISEFFSEQFGILYEQIIPTGMPRMDKYIDPDNRRQITEQLYLDYPMLKGKKVILFAPTYRGRNRKTAYYPYELIDFAGLYDYACKNDAIILFKMHPWVPEEVPIAPEYADRFLCMNSYPNINDLFYVTDLLITDYSSSMFEFLLMRKPMLLFPFDKNQYASSRGFHRDYDSNVPGKICLTFDELLKAMNDEDYEFEKVDIFIDKYFDNPDSNSCDRVIDWLILGNLPERFSNALEAQHEKIQYIRSLNFSPEIEEIEEIDEDEDQTVSV